MSLRLIGGREQISHDNYFKLKPLPLERLVCSCALPPSPILEHLISFVSRQGEKRFVTHTLAAHLVTFRPSLIQSISPVPCACVLQSMKSSLNSLHLAPIKKAADSRGAELEPISSTLGTLSGSGVVSTRTVWLNLET